MHAVCGISKNPCFFLDQEALLDKHLQNKQLYISRTRATGRVAPNQNTCFLLYSAASGKPAARTRPIKLLIDASASSSLASPLNRHNLPHHIFSVRREVIIFSTADVRLGPSLPVRLLPGGRRQARRTHFLPQELHIGRAHLPGPRDTRRSRRVGTTGKVPDRLAAIF